MIFFPPIDIASFGEFRSGVPLSDFINFQSPRSSVSLMTELTTSTHRSCLASVLAAETSLQVSNHSFLRVFICLRRLFRFLTRVRTFGDIHAVLPFPRLVFPTCFLAAVEMKLLNADALIFRYREGVEFFMDSSTAFLNSDQFTPLLRQRGLFPRIG